MEEPRFRAYLEPFLFDWSAFAPHEALLCLPAITIIIFSCVTAHHPGAGMIAGGGAVSVGFGSFQRIHKSRAAPMLLASSGMFISALVGTIAGHSVFVLAAIAALWGFLYGLLVALGAGASWVGLQCVIAMLVASGFPDSLKHAFIRALLILGGGLLQMLSIVLMSLVAKVERQGLRLPRDFSSGIFLPAAYVLKQNLTPSSAAYQYGLRLAVTLALTAGRCEVSLATKRLLGAYDGCFASEARFSPDSRAGSSTNRRDIRRGGGGNTHRGRNSAWAHRYWDSYRRLCVVVLQLAQRELRHVRGLRDGLYRFPPRLQRIARDCSCQISINQHDIGRALYTIGLWFVACNKGWSKDELRAEFTWTVRTYKKSQT